MIGSEFFAVFIKRIQLLDLQCKAIILVNISTFRAKSSLLSLGWHPRGVRQSPKLYARNHSKLPMYREGCRVAG